MQAVVRNFTFEVQGSKAETALTIFPMGDASISKLVIQALESPLPLCRFDSKPKVTPTSVEAEELFSVKGAALTLPSRALMHPELECMNSTDADPDVLIDFGDEVDLSTLTIMSSKYLTVA